MGREVAGHPLSALSYMVEQLIVVNPYNSDILPDLENYVNEQAMMAMPAPDFSLCLFLIPELVQMEEQFKTVIVLSHYLETARFCQFWDEAAKSRHIVEDV
ncbi:PREDICTED: eukaryotic translation initiation factor 3 subunit K-like [Ipomoea nil]|uniref:eukaryotic translation initiation factor 3 subunit K-like n=1 Tax=Ipomoea nil TaxID=35883 RepID=UPI000900C9DA|nr:PREDICTED: eukaryotic translation initiation factor 3 subunit K-like [Ipomoea nil]